MLPVVMMREVFHVRWMSLISEPGAVVQCLPVCLL